VLCVIRKNGYSLGDISMILDINKAGIVGVLVKFNKGKGTFVSGTTKYKVDYLHPPLLEKVRKRYGIMI